MPGEVVVLQEGEVAAQLLQPGLDADDFARLELDELLREVEAFTNRADTTIAALRNFASFGSVP